MRNENGYNRMADRLGLGWRKPERTPRERKFEYYGFFLVHMGFIGTFMFFWTYFGEPSPWYLPASAFFIATYLFAYVDAFGIDEVRWALINGVLGMFGVYAQLGWALELFGKYISSYSLTQHVIPGFFYVMYTFMLHQLVLDVCRARENRTRKAVADAAYIVGSILTYGAILLLS